jgi:uncharacterized OsmC-like protein
LGRRKTERAAASGSLQDGGSIMSQTANLSKSERELNGVDVTALEETIAAVREKPALATFRFRARNEWQGGGHNRSTIREFYGCGEEDRTRTVPFVLDAAEPPVLLGEDQGANPVEYVLHALAGCMTTSLVYHAAARGIRIDEVESRLEGDLDLQGFLGLRDDVRKGYEQIRVHFRVKSDATADELKSLLCYSPVCDVVRNPTAVEIELDVV